MVIKNHQRIFDVVFEAIKPKSKEEVLIIGDSLSSDIQGGNNAGIATCWFNPKAHPHKHHLRIDHEIKDLRELYDIVGKGDTYGR